MEYDVGGGGEVGVWSEFCGSGLGLLLLGVSLLMGCREGGGLWRAGGDLGGEGGEGGGVVF